MICFICKHSAFNFTGLLAHFKIINLLKPLNSYECRENECTQTFPNLNSYKKHTIRPYNSPTPVTLTNDLINNNVDNACINTNQNDAIEIHNTLTIILDNNRPKPIENYDILDLDNAINSYHMSAVKFTLSLLDNNFSRKDVFEIQRKIEKYIIKPVEN